MNLIISQLRYTHVARNVDEAIRSNTFLFPVTQTSRLFLPASCVEFVLRQISFSIYFSMRQAISETRELYISACWKAQAFPTDLNRAPYDMPFTFHTTGSHLKRGTRRVHTPEGFPFEYTA